MDVGELTEGGLLDCALRGGEEDEVGLGPGLVLLVRAGLGGDADEGGDFFLGLEFQEIGDAAALGGAAHVGNLMDALDIDAAGVGEEHEVIVRAGGEEVLDKILVLARRRRSLAGGHADDALAAAALGAIGADGGALDQAGVGDGDDDAFVGDEVFDGDLAFVGDQLGEARGGVFGFDLAQLVLDDGEDAGFLGQDVEQILDALEDLGVFGLDLVNFQAGQLVEAQLQNRGDLGLAEGIAAAGQAVLVADENAEALDLGAGEVEGQQFDARLLAVGGLADDADELVQVGQGDEVALQRFGAVLGLAQLKTGAADDHFAAVLDVAIDDLFEIQDFGPAVVNGQGS